MFSTWKAKFSGLTKRFHAIRLGLSWKQLTLLGLIANTLRPQKILHKCVVSVTSFPERFELLPKTLDSVIRQTFRPEKLFIVLCHDEVDELPSRIKNYEETYEWIEIIWQKKSLGPYNKLLPVVRCAQENEYSVVTIDDDVEYGPFFLSNFRRYVGGESKVVVGLRGWEVTLNEFGLQPYISWPALERVRRPRNIFLTGVGGILYPPDFFTNPLLADWHLALRLSNNNDDVWFWALARLSKVETVFKKPLIRPFFKPIKKKKGMKELYRVNRSGGAADRAFLSVVSHFGPRLLDPTVSTPG